MRLEVEVNNNDQLSSTQDLISGLGVQANGQYEEDTICQEYDAPTVGAQCSRIVGCKIVL